MTYTDQLVIKSVSDKSDYLSEVRKPYSKILDLNVYDHSMFSLTKRGDTFFILYR